MTSLFPCAISSACTRIRAAEKKIEDDPSSMDGPDAGYSGNLEFPLTLLIFFTKCS